MTTRILPFHQFIPAPELRFYREETKCLLRRYFRLSLAIGRVPNIMGRGAFRSKPSNIRLSGLEDAVIFVVDLDRILQRLDTFAQQLISRCILQEYSYAETASILGCNERTVRRRLPDALDQLSEILITVGLLNRDPEAASIMKEDLRKTMAGRIMASSDSASISSSQKVQKSESQPSQISVIANLRSTA